MSPQKPGPGLASHHPARGAAGEEVSASARDPLSPWLSRAAAGDARAATRLLEAVAPSVLGLVRVVLGRQSPEVEDVAQEALLAIHDAVGRFRGDSSFGRYARRIAVRTALAARRRRRPSEPLEEEIAAADAGHDERMGRERRLAALRGLLDELPAAQAESIAMRVMLGCSLGEVADATGVPMNTVRSRIRLAKEHIKRRIAEDGRLADLFDVEALGQA